MVVFVWVGRNCRGGWPVNFVIVPTGRIHTDNDAKQDGRTGPEIAADCPDEKRKVTATEGARAAGAAAGVGDGGRGMDVGSVVMEVGVKVANCLNMQCTSAQTCFSPRSSARRGEEKRRS
jgi:hypothetical protein